MKPRGPPYLAFVLDAIPKARNAALAVGLPRGEGPDALLSLWEHAWREQIEWVTPNVLLGCCSGHERLPDALREFGFLEPVEAGWSSPPATPEPIPVAGYRIRGARRYLRVCSPQSLGGQAARGNLIPGGPRRRQSAEPDGGATGTETSADARLTLGRRSADTSADPGHQRAASSEQRESQRQHLAGAVAPAGQPPPSTPSQTLTPPAKDAQEPAQALLEGVPERPAKKAKRSRDAADRGTSPHFRALSDRLVDGYLRVMGCKYIWNGAADGEAVKRLCVAVGAGAVTVEELGGRFERGLAESFNPLTGIANFAARITDPRWQRGSTRAEDQQHNPIPGVYHG